MTAAAYIKQLSLVKHPEGGFYKETYRSSGMISEKCLTGFGGDRNFCTAIFYLLERDDFSAFHRIKSDECWHFYDGQTLLIHMLDAKGTYSYVRLGRNISEGELLQFVVPAGVWFSSEPAAETDFSLVGCTVAPGFDFADFEMADRQILLQSFPQNHTLISRLCREV